MKQKNIFFLTLSAVFIAIIAVMSFTPVGYLKIGIVEITLLVAPVVAGGILLGKWGGLLLGAAFGISSFLQCFGMSAFGATMLSINPVFTAIVCLLPRLALGFCAVWLFSALSKKNVPSPVSGALSFLCGSLLNTVLFVGLFVLLFGKTDYVASLMESTGAKNLLAFAAAFAGVNSLVEAAANAVLGAALTPVLLKLKKRARG
ncbi:MAG: ECF transporter S component [Clostridia bacterium]|nr:ECF transporter S component [Clostridia bacterium]